MQVADALQQKIDLKLKELAQSNSTISQEQEQIEIQHKEKLKAE